MKTIKSSSEITRIFEEGRRVGTPELSLIVLRNEQHDREGRVAFIAGKKLGNAVWRNRAKRRMRSVCRDLKVDAPGTDIVFLARGKIAEAPYEELKRHTEQALAKAHLNHD